MFLACQGKSYKVLQLKQILQGFTNLSKSYKVLQSISYKLKQILQGFTNIRKSYKVLQSISYKVLQLKQILQGFACTGTVHLYADLTEVLLMKMTKSKHETKQTLTCRTTETTPSP